MRERGGVEGLESVGPAIYSPAEANKTVQRTFMVRSSKKLPQKVKDSNN